MAALAWLPTLYLIMLSLAARRCPPPWPPPGSLPHPLPRLHIVIPAHDEAALIADTVAAALTLDYPRNRFDVWVIANACRDDTAERAKMAGANVLELATPGKGQALDFALGHLLSLPEPWDAVVVLDADSTLSSNALQIIAQQLAAGSAAIQLRYAVRNMTDHPRTRTAALQLTSYNGVRPAGRDALGWSAGLFGNGFALTRQTIQQVPYRCHSIIEDLEYHQRLQAASIRVRFADAAVVWAEMPQTRRQLATQRVRWERGRLQLMRQDLCSSEPKFASSPFVALGRIAELYCPPVSWIALAFLAAFCCGNPNTRLAAAMGLGALGWHYWDAARRYGLQKLFVTSLWYFPWFVVEKLVAVLLSFWREPTVRWHRTQRRSDDER